MEIFCRGGGDTGPVMDIVIGVGGTGVEDAGVVGSAASGTVQRGKN